MDPLEHYLSFMVVLKDVIPDLILTVHLPGMQSRCQGFLVWTIGTLYKFREKREGRLPKAFEFKEELCLNKADISDLGKEEIAQNWSEKLLLFAIYFILRWYSNLYVTSKIITFPFDLYITTTHLYEESVRALFTIEFPDVETTVLAVNNRGKRYCPFIAFAEITFDAVWHGMQGSFKA